MQMNRIKDLRAEIGMKQTDLAERLGVVRTSISNYENEVNQLDPPTIQRLCEIFHVTADYLLGFSEIRSPAVTEGEMLLVEAYRAADPRAKAVVDLTLEPWLGGVRRAEGE